jgi:hypothetical protein
MLAKHYKILSETSGGKLTPEEVYNLETYGVKSAMEFAPDLSDEPKPGYCVCGVKDCDDAYAHTTSGF